MFGPGSGNPFRSMGQSAIAGTGYRPKFEYGHGSQPPKVSPPSQKQSSWNTSSGGQQGDWWQGGQQWLPQPAHQPMPPVAFGSLAPMVQMPLGVPQGFGGTGMASPAAGASLAGFAGGMPQGAQVLGLLNQAGGPFSFGPLW